MSLEEALSANTAATERNSALLERVVAGQEAAIAKLDSGGATTRKPRTTKVDPVVAEAEPVGNDEPAATESAADVVTPASEPASEPAIGPVLATIGSDPEKLKAYVSAWTGSTEDAAVRAERVGLLKSIATKHGVEPKFAQLLPHAKSAVFLIERAKALGLDAVDLAADYDLDGDPTQGGAADSESDSDFD